MYPNKLRPCPAKGGVTSPNAGEWHDPGLLTHPATQAPYPYALNNPLRYTDPSGQFVDTVLDAVSLGWDIYTITDKARRGCAILFADWLTLGLNALSLALPFVPALGLVTRLAAHADNLGDVLKLVNRPADIVHNAKAVDQALGGGEEVIEAIARGRTYRLLDPITGEVQYVGRTKNLVRRLVEHRRDPIKGQLEFDVDWRTDDYGIQRGREQMLYDLYHPLLNRIQPISLQNPKMGVYLNAARRYGE